MVPARTVTGKHVLAFIDADLTDFPLHASVPTPHAPSDTGTKTALRVFP